MMPIEMTNNKALHPLQQLAEMFYFCKKFVFADEK